MLNQYQIIENVKSKQENRYGLTIIFRLDETYRDQRLIKVLKSIQINLSDEIKEFNQQDNLHATLVPIYRAQPNKLEYEKKMKEVKRYLTSYRPTEGKLIKSKIDENGDILLIISNNSTGIINKMREELSKLGVERKHHNDKNNLYLVLG